MIMAPLGELSAATDILFSKTDDLVGMMPVTGSTAACSASPAEITAGQPSPSSTPTQNVVESGVALIDAAATKEQQQHEQQQEDEGASALATIAKMVRGVDTRDSGLLEKLMLDGQQLTKTSLLLTEKNLSGMRKHLDGHRANFFDQGMDMKRYSEMPRRDQQRLDGATRMVEAGIAGFDSRV